MNSEEIRCMTSLGTALFSIQRSKAADKRRQAGFYGLVNFGCYLVLAVLTVASFLLFSVFFMIACSSCPLGWHTGPATANNADQVKT